MSDEDDEEMVWTLENLPLEVFLHITTFIPASTLVHSLSLVSKHFHTILTNEQTWKIRAGKMWPGKYPPIDFEQAPLFHRLSTLKREQTLSLWSTFQLLQFNPHIACVDAVLLFKGNSMLATGSRDRSLTLTNVDVAIENNSSKVDLVKNNAHTGWIWDLVVMDEKLVSAGWDGFVKIWDLNSMKELQSFKTTSPNLCLSAEQNLLSIGSFNNKIHIYDVRTNEQVKTYKAHKRSVLSLGLENNKIVSAGEDNRIVLHDLRMDKLTAGLITLPQSGPQKTYPKSISYAKTSNSLPYFYIGDIRGNLYLINSHFKIEKIYPKIHSQAIQAVFHTICSVYSCSSDGKLIIHEPSEELGIVKQISMEKVELTKVHVLNHRVAVAGSDSLVRVYFGKSS